MANQEHVDILLRDGVEVWNKWRDENRRFRSQISTADLSGADLHDTDLRGANLYNVNICGANLAVADLRGANLQYAKCRSANLRIADLRGANLQWADLSLADLSGANLNGANLLRATFRRTQLNWANLTEVNLTLADLTEANCSRANFAGATLRGCYVYGISAWDVNLEGAVQADLRIAPVDEPHITVDNLKVAQFLYLLMHDGEMRTVLDTVTSKVVLILGRFSDERKPILDAIREALRRHPNGYIPVLFDFEPQADKPVLETVKTLANLARFVIADLTDPHMIRAELTAIIPNVPTVPIQPIVEGITGLPTEYESWTLYRSVLPVYRYADLPNLLANLNESVLMPVEAHVQARRL